MTDITENNSNLTLTNLKGFLSESESVSDLFDERAHEEYKTYDQIFKTLKWYEDRKKIADPDIIRNIHSIIKNKENDESFKINFENLFYYLAQTFNKSPELSIDYLSIIRRVLCKNEDIDFFTMGSCLFMLCEIAIVKPELSITCLQTMPFPKNTPKEIFKTESDIINNLLLLIRISLKNDGSLIMKSLEILGKFIKIDRDRLFPEYFETISWIVGNSKFRASLCLEFLKTIIHPKKIFNDIKMSRTLLPYLKVLNKILKTNPKLFNGCLEILPQKEVFSYVFGITKDIELWQYYLAIFNNIKIRFKNTKSLSNFLPWNGIVNDVLNYKNNGVKPLSEYIKLINNISKVNPQFSEKCFELLPSLNSIIENFGAFPQSDYIYLDYLYALKNMGKADFEVEIKCFSMLSSLNFLNEMNNDEVVKKLDLLYKLVVNNKEISELCFKLILSSDLEIKENITNLNMYLFVLEGIIESSPELSGECLKCLLFSCELIKKIIKFKNPHILDKYLNLLLIGVKNNPNLAGECFNVVSKFKHFYSTRNTNVYMHVLGNIVKSNPKLAEESFKMLQELSFEGLDVTEGGVSKMLCKRNCSTE